MLTCYRGLNLATFDIYQRNATCEMRARLIFFQCWRNFVHRFIMRGVAGVASAWLRVAGGCRMTLCMSHHCTLYTFLSICCLQNAANTRDAVTQVRRLVKPDAHCKNIIVLSSGTSNRPLKILRR